MASGEILLWQPVAPRCKYGGEKNKHKEIKGCDLFY